MPKMVCTECAVELKPEKNGVYVAELFQNNSKIYKLWRADKWKCPGCKIEIVAGFAAMPVMEHFEGNIELAVRDLRGKGIEVIYDSEVI